MTQAKAYRLGWNASERTRTYDLTAAEMRFEARYGATFSDDFARGWIDYAAGNEKNPTNVQVSDLA